jgi:hypothetical protein
MHFLIRFKQIKTIFKNNANQKAYRNALRWEIECDHVCAFNEVFQS